MSPLMRPTPQRNSPSTVTRECRQGNVGTGQYLTAGRHGGVGISSQPFIWQQVELPAA